MKLDNIDEEVHDNNNNDKSIIFVDATEKYAHEKMESTMVVYTFYGLKTESGWSCIITVKMVEVPNFSLDSNIN